MIQETIAFRDFDNPSIPIDSEWGKFERGQGSEIKPLAQGGNTFAHARAFTGGAPQGIGKALTRVTSEPVSYGSWGGMTLTMRINGQLPNWMTPFDFERANASGPRLAIRGNGTIELDRSKMSISGPLALSPPGTIQPDTMHIIVCWFILGETGSGRWVTMVDGVVVAEEVGTVMVEPLEYLDDVQFGITATNDSTDAYFDNFSLWRLG